MVTVIPDKVIKYCFFATSVNINYIGGIWLGRDHHYAEEIIIPVFLRNLNLKESVA